MKKEDFTTEELEILKTIGETKTYNVVKKVIRFMIADYQSTWESAMVTDDKFNVISVGIQKSITSLKNLMRAIEKIGR